MPNTAVWLAGVLDKGGCFTSTNFFQPQIIMHSISEPLLQTVLDAVRELGFDGKLKKINLRSPRPSYQLLLTDQDATGLAQAIVQHMRIRGREAELLVEMQKHKDLRGELASAMRYEKRLRGTLRRLPREQTKGE